LHRDIKPGNFAIGRRDLRHIYLLDFGMCRKYLNKRASIRNPRRAAGFRGTIRYASISSHISREQCRKDDLESWMYQQVGSFSYPNSLDEGF
uniref:Protein kinase domain-containing protein n=1 Tax=Gongylonema pulchrum TaxID=637853 RepID=A0A183DL10_9BILA